MLDGLFLFTYYFFTMNIKARKIFARMAVAAALSAALAGSAFYAFAEFTADTPRISNLWPFSVIEKLSESRTFNHAVSPLFTRSRRPESDRETFRPILTTVKEYPDESVTVDFLPPIGHATRSETDRSFHIFPLISHRAWISNDGSKHRFSSFFPIFHHKSDGPLHHTAFFPIYMSGTAGNVSYPIPFKSSKDYVAVFPFYGNLYGALGNDRITFAFWPLYTRIEKKISGSETPFVKHQVLWPIFTFGSGGGYKSFKVWPIYGQTVKEGQYASRFFAWPIFNITRNLNTDTSNPKDITAGLPIYWDIQEGKSHSRSFFPFYGKRTTPDLERSFKVWPAYINTKYIKGGYSTKDYLWPVFSKTEGAVTGYKFWPLFGTKKKSQIVGGTVTEDVSTFYLWTIGKYERSITRDSKRTYNRMFPLFVIGRYDDAAGYKQRQVFLWPLISYQEDNLQQAKAISFPNLLGSFESQFPMIQEVYSPLWRVIDYARQGDESRLTLLWNFVDIRKDRNQMAMSVGPIFTLHRGESGLQEYTLLSTFHIKNRGSMKVKSRETQEVVLQNESLPPLRGKAGMGGFQRQVSSAWNTGVVWAKSVGARVSNFLTVKQ